ncbi:MAG: DoxX family protein [Saprospiraceae bacterium]|mgnify:CR=1 FL=1
MKFEKTTDLALLILRLVFGFAMVYGHGWGKLMKFFSDDPLKFGDPLGIGPVPSLVLVTTAEFLCALLLAFGLFTRWSLVPLIIAMSVACFIAHGGDPFGKMEKSLLYLAVYVSLFITGPGWYSLDRILFKKV